MKRKSVFIIVPYLLFIWSYVLFIFCWIFILQTRIQLDGQSITLQQAEQMKKFSFFTALSEKVIYLNFFVIICYEWFIGKKNMNSLIKRELTALLCLLVIGGIVAVCYKIIMSAEIMSNAFEPIYVCIAIAILSTVFFSLFKLKGRMR